MAEQLSKAGKVFESLLSVFKQWGLATTDQYGTAWVSYPITFKICIPIILAIHNGLNAVNAYISSDYHDNKQAAIVLKQLSDSSGKSGWGVSWIAIGY